MTSANDTDKFTGLLLAESLDDQSIFSLVRITREETWDVGDRAADFQPRTWTAIYFKGDEFRVELVAEALSHTLKDRWYANMSAGDTEFVVFRGRVFEHEKGDRVGAASAVEYGRSQGIPEHQLDWIGD